MVEISPAFHANLPPFEGLTPWGIALTDLSELASVLVSTYDLKSATYSDTAGTATGHIVLTVLHLPTQTTRRVVIRDAMPTVNLQAHIVNGGHDEVLFAARPIGQGRVLLWYGRTHQTDGTGRSPYVLRVLDASQRELQLGPAVPIVQLSEGRDGTQGEGYNIEAGGLRHYLGVTSMGVHRSTLTQYTAIFPVLTSAPAGPDLSAQHPHATVRFATRNFTVEGSTIAVDYSPWELQGRVDLAPEPGVEAGFIYDEFGRTTWSDEPITSNALVRDWIWGHHARWYTLRWDGTRITGATSARLWASEAGYDGGLGAIDTYANTPLVKEGVLRTFSIGTWNSPSYANQDGVFTARPGQRPVPMRVQDREAGGFPMNHDTWLGSQQRAPNWVEAGEYPAGLVRQRADYEPGTPWAVGVFFGPHLEMIPDARQKQAPGSNLPWVTRIYEHSERYIGEIASLRGGYIIATWWDPPANAAYQDQPWWRLPTGEIGVSVWQVPDVASLETGAHRARGHFS